MRKPVWVMPRVGPWRGKGCGDRSRAGLAVPWLRGQVSDGCGAKQILHRCAKRHFAYLHLPSLYRRHTSVGAEPCAGIGGGVDQAKACVGSQSAHGLDGFLGHSELV